MHIVYIEFKKTKSKYFKKIVDIAKLLPNYQVQDDIYSCYVDTIIDYISYQPQINTLIHTIINWKSSKVILLGKVSKVFPDYFFLDNMRDMFGKYKELINSSNINSVAMNDITYEDLPLPFVYYPPHYGAFFAFSKDIGDKIVFCECERKRIENYLKLKKEYTDSGLYNDSKKYPLDNDFFPLAISELSYKSKDNPLAPFSFEEKICFKCNNKIPMYKYCDPMYGGVFEQKYGWFINQEYFKIGINPNKIFKKHILWDAIPMEDYCYNSINKLHIEDNLSEMADTISELNLIVQNKVREDFGFPKIGEYWISETILFKIISKIFAGEEIIRHYRPDWLHGLELDIFIPTQNIAFEYQGIQHFKPVEHWGGQKQLEKQQEHDRIKKEICIHRNINLICINYDDELSENFVKSKLK